MMKELQIDDGNAFAQAMQRRLERRAERQFLHHLAELHLDRIEGLVRHGFQAAVDVVAGAHGAGEQVDGVGQLFLELVQPAAADAA